MAQSEEPQEERYLGLTPMQLNVTFLAIVGIVAIAAALYFNALGAVQDAIGGGDDESASVAAPSETPTAAPADTPASGETPAPEDDSTGDAQAAADAALLTLDDMPTGWFAQPADAEDDDDPFSESDFSEECQGFIEEDELPGELLSSESPTFEGPDGQTIDHSVSAFDSAKSADAAVDGFADWFDRCGDEFAALFKTAAEGEADREPGTYELRISLFEISYPALGDATHAYRMEGVITYDEIPFPLTFVMDFILIRQGEMTSFVFYYALPFSGDVEEEALARKAASKLSDALELLRS